MTYPLRILLVLTGLFAASCTVSPTVSQNATQLQADFVGCMTPINTSSLEEGTKNFVECAQQTRDKCWSGEGDSVETCFARQNAAIRDYYASAKSLLPPTIEGDEIIVRLYREGLADTDRVFTTNRSYCPEDLDLAREQCGFLGFVMEFVDLVGAAVDAEVELPS